MVKLIVFDLDGVLVDARELHYEALNRALLSIDEKYVINRSEHLSLYDGLPTSKKLAMLTEKKGLSEELHQEVWKRKQMETRRVIDEEMTVDLERQKMLKTLRAKGYQICVASNVRESVKMMLIRKGLLENIDFFFSNQDVSKPKPHPEIYLKCMIAAGTGPKETLVVEDSHVGRKAALDSGAHLCPVRNVDDVTIDYISSYLSRANSETSTKPKWQGGSMNILIPMAGAGSRFENR